ncbi:MAG: DUF4038 domain-containing protein [Acidobacteria bacterium]|nr:MAG: DUF4038 domain-containing protein [Acidobacteriota bacterium]
MKPIRNFAIVICAVLCMHSLALAAVPGPIKVSPSGRHFVDRNNQPFFWLGDTAWPLLVQYSRPQAEAYLKTRSEQGFTVIQTVMAWGQGSGMEKKSPLPNSEGQHIWLDNNPGTPNAAYFKSVDALVEFADRQGLVMALWPTWGYYVVEAKTINLTNARAYGNWLGKRYAKTPNIVWVVGGDRVPVGFEEEYRQLALGLREGDQGAHLISYHVSGGRSSSHFFHRESWLDFNMIQTWCDWFQIYPMVSSDAMQSPVKPVVLCEGAYENGPEYPTGPITPLLVRRQAWWTVTAGGSHTYGQNQMWRMEPGWESTFGTPGALQVALMKTILTGLDWWDLVPDQAIFASGVSNERTLNAAMRSVKGDKALVYFASQCRGFINVSRIASKQAKATWISPVDGRRKDAGTYLTGNHNGRPFPDNRVEAFATPDHWEDALLLLEAVQ